MDTRGGSERAPGRDPRRRRGLSLRVLVAGLFVAGLSAAGLAIVGYGYVVTSCCCRPAPRSSST